MHILKPCFFKTCYPGETPKLIALSLTFIHPFPLSSEEAGERRGMNILNKQKGIPRIISDIYMVEFLYISQMKGKGVGWEKRV